MDKGFVERMAAVPEAGIGQRRLVQGTAPASKVISHSTN